MLQLVPNVNELEKTKHENGTARLRTLRHVALNGVKSLYLISLSTCGFVVQDEGTNCDSWHKWAQLH